MSNKDFGDKIKGAVDKATEGVEAKYEEVFEDTKDRYEEVSEDVLKKADESVVTAKEDINKKIGNIKGRFSK